MRLLHSGIGANFRNSYFELLNCRIAQIPCTLLIWKLKGTPGEDTGWLRKLLYYVHSPPPPIYKHIDFLNIFATEVLFSLDLSS